MSIATLISRILGLVRDVFFAFYFGTSWTYDVYLISFMIPQFLRRMVAEGALSSSAIPVMVEYKETNEEKNFLDSLFTYTFILLFVIVILGVMFPRVLISIFATGLINEPQKMNLALLLVRLMFPFIGFISVSSLIMGLLNSYGIFFPSAFAPAILNMTIISSVLLSTFFKVNIVVPAIAVSVGGFIQLIYQCLFLKKTNYKFSINLKVHPGIKKVLNLFWPIFISYGITQINSIVDLNIASWLPSGSISSLQYAMRLFQLPIGVFAVAFSTAMLPRFSSMHLKNDLMKLKSSLELTMSQMAFFIFPIVIIYLTSSKDIITVIFGYGKFDYKSIEVTSKVLLAYSLGILGYSFTYLLSRFFTGMRDTKTPMKITIVAAVVNIILDISLVFSMHQVGLALATSIAGIVSATMLFIKAKAKIGKINYSQILKIAVLSSMFLIKSIVSTKNPYMNIFIVDLSILLVYLLLSKIWNVNYLDSLIRRKNLKNNT